MPHDFEGQHWAENHKALSDYVAQLFASIIKGLDRLHALTHGRGWHVGARFRALNAGRYRRADAQQ